MASASIPATRFLPWLFALASLNGVLLDGRISQINRFYPKFCYLDCFITAVESKPWDGPTHKLGSSSNFNYSNLDNHSQPYSIRVGSRAPQVDNHKP